MKYLLMCVWVIIFMCLCISDKKQTKVEVNTNVN